MGKKKKALKAKLKKQSKIFMLIYIVAAYFTGLFTLHTIAYADLEVCKAWWPQAFYSSQWPVGYVLGNFDRERK